MPRVPPVPELLAPGRVECRVLGPLEVRAGGWPVVLGGRKQRLVLATLLLAGGRPVSADRLVDVLWGEDAPPTARNTLQAHVSGLRRALGPAGAPAVVRRDPGYAVDLAGADLDLARFRAAVEAGRTALGEGRPDAAVPPLDAALALWPGPPLADLADEPGLAADLRALAEERLVAVASRAEAHLALGSSAALVAELTELVAEHPLTSTCAPCWSGRSTARAGPPTPSACSARAAGCSPRSSAPTPAPSCGTSSAPSWTPRTCAASSARAPRSCCTRTRPARSGPTRSTPRAAR